MQKTRLAITLAFVFVLVTFGGAIYDRMVGRDISFTDFLGVTVSLLFLALAALAWQGELAVKQRELERKVRSLEDSARSGPGAE